MTGHGEKLSRKADDLIIALLANETIAAAAKAAGVSEKTAWRWLQDEDFQRRYREARRRVVEQALTAIQAATTEAVETLRRNLHCEKPAVEVRAAESIIATAVKAVEFIDIEERLAMLEARIGEQRPGKKALSQTA